MQIWSSYSIFILDFPFLILDINVGFDPEQPAEQGSPIKQTTFYPI